jgi:antitoxin MazE
MNMPQTVTTLLQQTPKPCYNFVPTKLKQEHFMQTSIKRMGNSAAILLPKTVLAYLQVAVGDQLELDLIEGKVVLSAPQTHPRAGWAEAAKALAAEGAAPEWPAFNNADDEDWTW